MAARARRGFPLTTLMSRTLPSGVIVYCNSTDPLMPACLASGGKTGFLRVRSRAASYLPVCRVGAPAGGAGAADFGEIMDSCAAASDLAESAKAGGWTSAGEAGLTGLGTIGFAVINFSRGIGGDLIFDGAAEFPGNG